MHHESAAVLETDFKEEKKESSSEIISMGHDASDNDEVGKCLVERVIIKLVNKTNRNEAVCGTRNGGAEAETQDDTNNPQGSNIKLCQSRGL